MAKTYSFEYNNACDSRQADLQDQSTNSYYIDGSNYCCGNFRNNYTEKTIRLSIDSTAPVAIDIWFSYRIIYDDPWTHSENNYQTFATIAPGALYIDYTFYDWSIDQYVDMCPGGGCAREVTTIDTLVFMDQPVIPEVCIPLGCSLGISGYTVTAPTQRGLSDGSMTIGVTGQTGTTITWTVDGIPDGTGTTITFIGLTVGAYIIRATEADCWSQQTINIPDGEFRTGDFTVVSPSISGNTVAVENPILLTLSTAVNNPFPVYSENTFTITGSVSNVVINFDLSFPYSYQSEFKSKGFPDRSTYFLETNLTDAIGNFMGTNSAAEIATSLAEVLQKDAILSRIYYISNASNVITLKAREYGSDYNLTSTNVTITGSNISLSNTISGIAYYDGQLTANYSLYTELFILNGIEYGDTLTTGDYQRILELELPFNKTNIHQFDLSSSIKNFVSTPKFDFGLTGFTYLSNWLCSYYCKYGEKYPLIQNTNTKKKRYKGEIDKGYAVNSALNFEDPNSMNIYFGTSGITGVNNVKFLNTAGNTKYSHRDAQELMTFVLPKNYLYATAVYGNIYLYDGSIYNNVKLFDITTTGNTINFGGATVIMVGYDDMGLSTYESQSKIRKVDIQVKQFSGSTWVSYTEVKSYLLEIDEQPDNYNVVFLNKLGTYETYAFTGERIDTADISRDLYQKPYTLSPNGSASLGFQYNSTIDTNYTKTFTINTGIIDSLAFDYLQGLLQSNRIYHYDDVHQVYLNVIGQQVSKSTNTNEYSVQVQFKETIIENNVNQ